MKPNSKHPAPGEVREALASNKLTAADLAALPAIIQKYRAKGEMSFPADQKRPVSHYRKETA